MNLEKQLERTRIKADRFKQKSRDYKKMVAQIGDFKDMSPDEIKVKLDQIYDWNDKNNQYHIFNIDSIRLYENNLCIAT